ncbi:MAG: YkgJ family cysteine cluster protein [Flavobacteriales bacterium]|nr:YkgJ family cysteine cluster protein [Flavobacteriales bacterium]
MPRKPHPTKDLFKQLKRAKDRELDSLFHEAHEEVFAVTDCLECANCCKTTSPIFRDRDIDRLAKRLRVRPSRFIDQYLRMDEDHDYVLKSSPCTFLNEDNTCSVYEDRPLACREYPHTDRKKMSQILDLTYRNTMVCPAVEHIVEKIRKRLQAR